MGEDEEKAFELLKKKELSYSPSSFNRVGNYAELTINNNMQKNTDIIIDLKGENTYAFGEMYKNYFGMVNRFVINNNGTTNDAEDIFQDTMLILVEKLRKDNFVLTASLKTYTMAISKNLWFKN